MAYNTKIPLFRRWVLQNFPFIEQDFDALTDYQLICKVVEYLNKCIETVNASTEQIEILTNAFNQLKDYVDHYFDTLDLQEEVNNKLEQMAEDGTLQEIIATYIQSNVAWTFDNVAEMLTATNVVDGSYARTLGYYDVNDEGGAFYIIRSAQPDGHYETLNNGLYAELITGIDTNLRQFGAKGDGINDDTSIIQEAINSVNHLIIPDGTYLFSSTLNIPHDKTIVGQNMNLTTLLYSGTSTAVNIQYKANGRLRLENITIQKNGGFSVDDSTSCGINVDTTYQRYTGSVLINNVTVKYFYRGLYSAVASGLISSRIYNSSFINNNIGMDMVNPLALSIHGSFISSNKTGIQLNGGELDVNNCNLTYNAVYAVRIIPNGGKFIFNQSFFECDNTTDAIGIVVPYSQSTYHANVNILRICGCHFWGMSKQLYIANTKYLTVENNTFINYGTYGFQDAYYVEPTDAPVRWVFNNNYFETPSVLSQNSYVQADDTGWVAIDTTAMTKGTWSEPLYARRIGNVTYLKGKLGSLANTDTGGIGLTLPKPFAPVQQELRITPLSGSAWFGGSAVMNFTTSYTNIVKMNDSASTNNVISFDGISWIN